MKNGFPPSLLKKGNEDVCASHAPPLPTSKNSASLPCSFRTTTINSGGFSQRRHPYRKSSMMMFALMRGRRKMKIAATPPQKSSHVENSLAPFRRGEGQEGEKEIVGPCRALGQITRGHDVWKSSRGEGWTGDAARLRIGPLKEITPKKMVPRPWEPETVSLKQFPISLAVPG